MDKAADRASLRRDERSAPMARALKVYRTPIGFHDAYVAAPSQKAALEAWGTETNLFARGAAEQVTEADLIQKPLANPGTVIKRPRGSEAEHLASLGTSKRKSAQDKSSSQKPGSTKPAAKKRPPPPRPSRDALEAAEEALAQQEEAAKAEMRLLEEEQAQLRARIDRLRKKQQAAADRLTRRAASERRKYEGALQRWRAT